MTAEEMVVPATRAEQEEREHSFSNQTGPARFHSQARTVRATSGTSSSTTSLISRRRVHVSVVRRSPVRCVMSLVAAMDPHGEPR